MIAETAVQLYALKDPWARDETATLRRIAELGIAGVEAYGLGETVVDRDERIRRSRDLRTKIADAGLALSGAHTLLPTADDADWLFEAMAVLETPVAIAATTERVLGFTRDALSDRDRLPRFADRLNALAGIAAGHGIRIGYHNHWWEWADVDGRPAYDRLVELLAPEIVLEVDLYWAYAAAQDVPGLVKQYADRIELVHVKDGDGARDAPQVAAGRGEVPIAAALEAGTGIKWNILELDVIAPGADVWDVVAEGAGWLASLA